MLGNVGLRGVAECRRYSIGVLGVLGGTGVLGGPGVLSGLSDTVPFSKSQVATRS